MSDTVTKPLRGRIPTFVAVLLLVAAVAGGGSVIYWWMTRERMTADVIAIEGNVPMRRNGMMQRERVPQKERRIGSVNKDKDGEIRAVAGGVALRLTPVAGKKPELHLVAQSSDAVVTPQQTQVIQLTRRLASNNAMVKRLNVTADQVQKLKQIPLDWELKLSDKERAQLETLCVQWDKAQGPAKVMAETTLLTTLRDTAPQAIASTKQAVARNIDQAKAVFTAQQWQDYQQLQNGKAAPKPAAAPAPAKQVQTTPPAKKPATGTA